MTLDEFNRMSTRLLEVMTGFPSPVGVEYTDGGIRHYTDGELELLGAGREYSMELVRDVILPLLAEEFVDDNGPSA